MSKGHFSFVMELDIKQSTEFLKKGGTILYPTDTVWGIGCDATHSLAVEKIFKIKQRCESKSFIVLVDSFDMLEDYVEGIPDFVRSFLVETKDPVTVIYENPKKLAENVISAEGTVAIRLVHDVFCQRLINRLGKPIVSTSANISGQVTPKNFKQIDLQIIEKCDYVVSYRQDDEESRTPSRLIRFDSKGNLFFLR